MPPHPRAQWYFGLHRQAWQALAIGLIVALLLVNSGCIAAVLMPLPVIIHELGHAVAAWLFGRPAIPAFDFRYGGGITVWANQVPALTLIPYAFLATAGWLLRGRPLAIAAVVVATVLYSLLAWTRAHLIVIEAAGHGFELLFAAIFLHRAMTGWGLKLSVERPLYAILGFWFVFHNIRFAHHLMRDPVSRAEYAAAKGGGDWMDFAQLSRDLNLPFNLVVGIYFMCCLLTLALAYIAAGYTRQHRVVSASAPEDDFTDSAPLQ